MVSSSAAQTHVKYLGAAWRVALVAFRTKVVIGLLGTGRAIAIQVGVECGRELFSELGSGFGLEEVSDVDP